MDSLWQVDTDIFDYLRPSAHRVALNNEASVEKIQEVYYTACLIVAHLQHRMLFAQRWRFWQNKLQILNRILNQNI